MKNLSKIAILTLSSVLSFEILAPDTSATTQNKQQLIQVTSTDSEITKTDLIEKFTELFPDRFSFLDDSDFNMDSRHRYPNDETIHYSLNFHKEVDGERVNGHVEFSGENLAIQGFNYDPVNKKDALFPADYTKTEAKKVALTFLDNLSAESDYQLDTERFNNRGNQTLTEPIRYSFSFVRTENQIPISDQRIQVNVLGNGEIIGFHRQFKSSEPSTFDDITKIEKKDEVVKKIKENLSIHLKYQTRIDDPRDDRNVKLVYQPNYKVRGVHAISGEWQTEHGFSKNLPQERELNPITKQPLPPKHSDFSVEDAKEFAKEFLAVDSDDVTLSIDSVDERENHMGQEVINIHYMYRSSNGGHGTSLELDKDTGEILQYRDVQREYPYRKGEEKEEEGETGKESISSEAALDQAIKYLKKWAPSYLHNYAKPIRESNFKEEQDGYRFTFPRMVDGILLNRDQISVEVSPDGSLAGLHVRQQPIENWPSKSEIISEEEAIQKFRENIDLELRYTKDRNSEDEHYHLVYTPVFNDHPANFLDANTGKWTRATEEKNEDPKVSHPWAEDELNFLIKANILDLESGESFDADTSISKGDALEITMKSLTRFFDRFPRPQEDRNQSFQNITSDHPLYPVVERAVTMGILDTDHDTFNLDETLTREDLAVWYVRALGLEQAAQFSSLYQLDFEDTHNIQPDYIGYVGLANSLGLLTAHNNSFYPEQEVTYAQLAVASVRIGHEVYDEEPQRFY